MKKLFTLFALSAAVSFSAGARPAIAPVVGLNLSKASFKAGGEKISNDMIPGFHVGALADIDLVGGLSLMPGVLVSTKGFKMEEEDLGIKVKETIKPVYIEIPVNLAYKFGESGFFVHAGPYLGYAIGGKVKAEAMGAEVKDNIEFGDEAGQMKRLDFGLNVGAGYQLPLGFFVKAQYGLGLANTVAKGDSDNYIKNNTIGISVGYFFGRQ